MREEDIQNETDIQEERNRREDKILDRGVLKRPIKEVNFKKVITVDRGESVRVAIDRMREGRQGCVVVMQGSKLVGIFTERDLITKVLGKGVNLGAAPVGEYMTPRPTVLHLEDRIVYALHHMSLGGYRHIPLVNDQRRPVGILSIKDIVHYLMEFFPSEVLNIPPETATRTPATPEGG